MHEVIRLLISTLDKKQHNRDTFDCGVEPLNHFLQKQSSQIQKRNEAIIHVAHDGSLIAGFYSLSTFSLLLADDPVQFKKQSPHMPIPCMLIGRFAVDVNYQGKGLGTDLLIDALKKIKQVSKTVGIAFVVVDAKDDKAKAFYERFGFVEIQSKPLRLILQVSSIPSN